MHAVVVDVEIADLDEARRGLEQLVPGVRRAPGFVAGWWVSLDDGTGLSIAVYETEAQARAGAPPGHGSAPGVTTTRVAFGEVLAGS
jgi:hypothetical protein